MEELPQNEQQKKENETVGPNDVLTQIPITGRIEKNTLEALCSDQLDIGERRFKRFYSILKSDRELFEQRLKHPTRGKTYKIFVKREPFNDNEEYYDEQETLL